MENTNKTFLLVEVFNKKPVILGRCNTSSYVLAKSIFREKDLKVYSINRTHFSSNHWQEIMSESDFIDEFETNNLN